MADITCKEFLNALTNLVIFIKNNQNANAIRLLRDMGMKLFNEDPGLADVKDTVKRIRGLFPKPVEVPKSRPARWSDACSRALSAIQDLIDLQQEYQGWRENLPENLDSSPISEKLDAIMELDIENISSELSDIDGVELPRGFGRD